MYYSPGLAPGFTGLHQLNVLAPPWRVTRRRCAGGAHGWRRIRPSGDNCRAVGASTCAAAAELGAAMESEIEDDRHQYDDEVHALHRSVGVDRKGIRQGGERQENEAYNQPDHIGQRPLQIGAEQKNQHDRDTREGQDQTSEQTRHHSILTASGFADNLLGR